MNLILEKKSLRERSLPISVEMYHRLGEENLIPEKTELIEGVIIEKMPKSPKHSSFVRKLLNYFTNKISKKYLISLENPITTKSSEPEPDLCVLDFREDFYENAHPSFAHLVIEVSISTLELDRDKADVFALAEIPEYWIFDLVNQCLEVYRIPKEGEYKSRTILKNTETISPLFQPEIEIILKDFLY
ncbi:MAG: Uma2 family endonuclease [Leptospiraceae bacterium]|nr:Uma2 family endonuclease [Leptospiraceae bacterium]